MAKYLPAVDLWKTATHDAVISGRLKLQPGQWIRCGSDQLSRFVALRPSGTIWAVHPDGERGVSMSRLRQLISSSGR